MFERNTWSNLIKILGIYFCSIMRNSSGRQIGVSLPYENI